MYTGAVMMLFLFVLMLVGVDTPTRSRRPSGGSAGSACSPAIGLLVLLVGVVGSCRVPARRSGCGEAGRRPNPVAVARVLFGDYVFAIEVVGVLLVTAAVGALVLTHRRRLTPQADAAVRGRRADQGARRTA